MYFFVIVARNYMICFIACQHFLTKTFFAMIITTNVTTIFINLYVTINVININVLTCFVSNVYFNLLLPTSKILVTYLNFKLNISRFHYSPASRYMKTKNVIEDVSFMYRDIYLWNRNFFINTIKNVIKFNLSIHWYYIKAFSSEQELVMHNWFKCHLNLKKSKSD